MNSILRIISVAALSVIALSCTSEGGRDGSVRILLHSGDQVKTAISPSGDVLWSASESLAVLETADGSTVKYISDPGETSDGGVTMTFPVTVSAKSAASYIYNAVAPAAAMPGTPASASAVELVLPYSQAPVNGSFDPAADLLISKPEECYAQPGSLSLQFHRPVAFGVLDLTGLPVGTVLKAVTFSATKSGAPVPLAGTTTFNLGDASVPGGYGDVEAESTLVIDCSSLEGTVLYAGIADYNIEDPYTLLTEDGATHYLPSPGGALHGLYFTCWPFELEPGDSFTIVAGTGAKIYTRTVTIPDGRKLGFSKGDFAVFSVNMSSAIESAPGPMISSASFETAEGPAVAEFDDEARHILLRHVSDWSLLTSEEYAFIGRVTSSESVSGAVKTLNLDRGPEASSYTVELADYVAPGDSYLPASPGWTLHWNDEFSTADFDPATWRRSTPNGSYASCHHDATNADLVTVQDGYVRLWAKQVANGTPVSKSRRNGAEVDCPEQDGFSTGGLQMWESAESGACGQYLRVSEAPSASRIDVRARMTSAGGFWPAIWLLPYHYQPNPHGGEIDLMECATYLSKTWQTVHNTYTASTAFNSSLYPNSGNKTGLDWSEFHIFTVEITASALRYYIDGELILTWNNIETALGSTGSYDYVNLRFTSVDLIPTSSQTTYAYPYNVTDYMVLLTAQLGLNTAVGSIETWNWMNGSSSYLLTGAGLPAYMDVDFVRFYTK